MIDLDEQIDRMRERYAELQAVEASPLRQFPCMECRWNIPTHDKQPFKCRQPLISGGNEGEPNVDYQIYNRMWPSRNWPTVALCGADKLLWEPKPEPIVTMSRYNAWLLEAYGPNGKWVIRAVTAIWLIIVVIEVVVI